METRGVHACRFDGGIGDVAALVEVILRAARGALPPLREATGLGIARSCIAMVAPEVATQKPRHRGTLMFYTVLTMQVGRQKSDCAWASGEMGYFIVSPVSHDEVARGVEEGAGSRWGVSLFWFGGLRGWLRD